MQTTIKSAWAAGLLLAFATPMLGLAQDADEQEGEQAPVTAEVPLELEPTAVTGTRLTGGDPTARVLTITAEDIAKRGISSVEDVIRTIPQVFSSINGTTNMNFGSEAIDRNLGALSIGVSTANLKGFGSANTLVLLNGKRIAGAAGQEDFFVNLRNMPAGAIDRVEVNLDGGSSVYGSDGVAGVINIITRKDFQGGKVTLRHESSSNAADQSQLSAYYGHSWDTGNVSLNVSRTDSEPYSARKAGYYTKDWSSMFGGDQAYNFNVNPFSGQPLNTRSARVGVSRWAPANLTLPEGNDGRNAQPGDFRRVTLADGIEVLDVDAGGSTKDDSVLLSFEQYFADMLRVRGEYYRTEAQTNTRLTRFGTGSIAVPASNAFNNFGTTVYVTYDPQTEVDLGLLPTPERSSTNVSDRISGGIDLDFLDNFRLTIDWLRSGSDKDSYQYMLTNRARGPLSNEMQFNGRAAELIASPDPSEAVNFFGDGTGQNATIVELYGPLSTSSEGTETTEIDAFLNGKVLELPAGEVRFVLGGQQRKEELASADDFQEGFIGLERPYRELDAYFAELNIPILGAGNNMPGVQALTFRIAVRRDDYTVEGSLENDADGNPVLSKSNFANTSLGLGLRLTVTDTFAIRLRSEEAFRSPTVYDLFGGTQREFCSAFGTYDPLIDSFVPGACSAFGPNPDVKPEQSDNLSMGFGWQPGWAQGLTINVDYSLIDFQNRIASSSELRNLLPAEIYGNLPQFFERDPATGALIRSISRVVNISSREHTSLDFQLKWNIETQDWGTFTPILYYHYVIDMFDQVTADAPKARFLGEFVGIDKRKIQAQLDWFKGRLSASMFFNYTPGYLNNHYSSNAFGEPRVPDMQVDSRYTVDLSGTYQWDNGLLVRLGGRNIFDSDFPFALNGQGRPFDASRVDVRGQVWFAEVTYDF